MPLNANEFLLSDFEGRIHLVNQASNARLRSWQLAPIWRNIIRGLESAGDQYDAAARKLTRELIVLAPEFAAAEEVYRNWMKDDGLRGPIPDPAIVYLVVSCEKYKQKALPLYGKIASLLNPVFIVLGDETIDEAVFSGQFLTVPAPDNYECLTKKVLEALVAVRREFGKVGTLKIDDDCQFHAEPDRAKIQELVSSVDYAGPSICALDVDRCWHVGKCEYLKEEPYRKRLRGFYADGPLYYVGPNAVEFLVRDYTFFPGEFAEEIFEDKVVGDILRAHQITLSEARLPEIFGISIPVDTLAGAPELAPLTIDWQGVGGEALAQPTLIGGEALAQPTRLETQIKNNPENNQAWDELSRIYFSRYDLQKAFPLNSPASYAQLLEWAGATVPAIDPAFARLKAFQPTYKSMLELLASKGCQAPDP